LNGPTFSSDPIFEIYTNDKEEPIKQSILDFSGRGMDRLKDNVDFG